MDLKLIEKEHLIDNVWAFRFQPSEPMQWTAGQYVQVELPHDNPDDEGTKRYFTNSAAPYQGILQITTRVTDSTFKQALSKLEKGSADLKLLKEPSGDFVWEETDRPIVFVAGGIGVTPFYSIIKQRAHEGERLNLTLIYANRTDKIPFKDEFDGWAKEHPGFEIKYLTGQPLTAAKIAELAPGLRQSLVYLSGAEPMVESIGDDLKEQGLPETQLKQDFFPNYTEQNY